MTTRRHVLAETLSEYAAEAAGSGHTKLSISLPTDLLDEVRTAASESRSTVSAVIAAAVRSTLARHEQDRLDLALDAQREDALTAADALVPTVAALWSKLEW